MLGVLLLVLVVPLQAAVVLVHPVLGEGAVLDLGEDLLHLGLGGVGDDARAGDVVAPLGGLGDGPAHLLQAALVHEVHDQLQLVQALEVGDLRLVTGLGQRLEARLHQCGDTTGEHGLLTEQVGLGLLGEGGLDDTGAGAADALGVRQGQREGVAGGVLLHGHETGHTTPLLVLTAHQVARALRGDHADVHARRGLDEAEADVEAVAEEQRVAVLQVRGDGLLVHLGLDRVRDEDHDDVGLGGGLRRRHHAQALLLGLGLGLRALVQTDTHVHTGVTQRQGVGVALAAVADDRDLAALDDGQIGVGVVEQLGHKGVLLIE